jgi:hypothetical protein
VLLTEAPLNPKANRERMTQVGTGSCCAVTCERQQVAHRCLAGSLTIWQPADV